MVIEDLKLTNPDLFNDDDGGLQNFDNPSQDYEMNNSFEDLDENTKLDFNTGNEGLKKDLNSFLKKSDSDSTNLNAKIKQLGFIKDVSVNELAAQGVKISIRDCIIEKVLKPSD